MKSPATLLTLVSAALALGLAGLLPAVVCLLVMLLILIVGIGVPLWFPQVTAASWARTATAVSALSLVVLITALTGHRALITGSVDDPLASAAAVLAIPSGVPLGLLAALAAGSLIAVTLELGDRRGVQSGLVLGAAVLGLACVAAPAGQRLIVPIVFGWPAALLALTKLTTVQARPTQPDARMTVSHPAGAAGESRYAALLRWRIVPVVLAILLTGGFLGAAAVSGVAELAQNAAAHAGGGGGSGSSGTRSWDSKFQGGRMDLNSRGPLSNDPVAEVPADSPQHWRSAILDYYNGSGWQVTSSAGLTTTVTQNAGGLLLQTAGSDSALPASATADGTQGGEGAGNQARTDEVRIRGNGASQLIAPGRVVTARLPAGYAERTYLSSGNRVVLPSKNNDTYLVTSTVYPQTDRAATLGTAVRDEVGGLSSSTIDPRWLQVPDTLPVRVRELGVTLTASATTRLAAVQAVEARLGQLMSYTLDAAVPAQGTDAVDYSLFVSHQGFCEHFASAEVMLLRSAGIPARMVVGYRADGQDLAGAGRQIIRKAQAHAWVEVWFPGAGWVTSDPTPAGSVDQGFLNSVNSTFNRVMGDIADRFVAFVSGVVGPVILVAMFVLGWLFRRPLVQLLVRIGRFVRRKEQTTQDGESPIDPDLRRGFARLEAVLAERGEARAAHETLAAMRERLIGLRHYTAIGERAELEMAFAVLNRALYAAEPPTRSECLDAAKVFGQEADRRAAGDQPVASLGQSAQLM